MRLAPGMRLGDYEVLGLLGAGGMGEVYRARDGTLNRDVAIKLVHADFCENPDSLTRLRREARVLASINHPNVATLHELAEFGDGCGLVMELVSGETLADLLRQRPFSVADTLRFGAQVAAALEAAHERGLVHRDLKPANIKITSDGHAKVLDFGLAKVDASGAEASGATTIVTDQGAIVGTAPYMSPEQARGAPVDRRTDLWAFGCVLFEMLTGRRAFGGASHSDIIVAILERDPDFSSLPLDTPPLLERLIRRCLTKDFRRRYRDAGDARLELEDAATAAPAIASPQMPAVPARAGMRMAGAFALGTLLGGAIVAGWLRGPAGPAPGHQVQFAVTLPDEERLAATDLGEIAISPDGRNVVYVVARGGGTQLSIHSLGSAQSTPLRGTLNAVSPFFSPDGQWVGYFANGRLHKVAAAGGTPVQLCDAADGLGGSWSASGTIVFASATGSPLQRVADSGGTPSRATELDVSRGEFSHRWPSFLPDGETFLFSVGTVGDWDEAEVFAQGPDGQRTLIWKGGTNAKYLDAGYLSYGHKGAIWIVPFDAKQLKVTGTPQKVVEGIAASVDGAAHFSVSRDSTGVYVPANLSSSARRLALVQNGEVTPLAAPLHAYVTPRLSPDGRRVVLGVSEAAEHIWLFDVNAASLTQLTFDAANRAPTWSGDGRVTFASNRNGALNVFTAPTDGTGQLDRLSPSEYLQMPGSWSPDGETLALMEQNPTTGRDIWLLRSGERSVFANSPADESAARFSPDGQWIAYVSNESGQAEVYVRPTTGSAPARKVSTSGGMEPVWHPKDNGALLYRANDRLMMVPMRGGVPTAAPRVAFDGMANAGTFDAAGYDVMPGADRFLIITGSSQASAASQFRVILNWAPGAPAR